MFYIKLDNYIINLLAISNIIELKQAITIFLKDGGRFRIIIDENDDPLANVGGIKIQISKERFEKLKCFIDDRSEIL